MRRTKATLIYRRTGNPSAVQLLLAYRRIESTVRYLGVEVDDALDIAERIDVLITGAELPRSALRLARVNDRPSAHVSIDFRVLRFGYCAGVNPWRRMTSAIFA